MISNARADFNCFNLRLRGNENGWQTALANIESIWRDIYPEREVDIEFLDEIQAQFYEVEQRTAQLMRFATIVAMLLSCLGLLGLISFLVLRRHKEIGIRKVLGAKAGGILLLLSREFLMLIVVAAGISFPIAYIVMRKWLADYAYQIAIQWWMFVIVLVGILLVAFLTLSMRGLRAARMQPVEALRDE